MLSLVVLNSCACFWHQIKRESDDIGGAPQRITGVSGQFRAQNLVKKAFDSSGHSAILNPEIEHGGANPERKTGWVALV